MDLSLLPGSIAARIQLDPEAGCWLWTGSHAGGGYGHVTWHGRSNRVHRLVYQLLVGPIPEALVLDHLCRVRRCCNPAHLEPVTLMENSRRARAGVRLRDEPAPTNAERNRQRRRDPAYQRQELERNRRRYQARRLDPVYQQQRQERNRRRVATGKHRKARPGPGQASLL